MLDIALQEYGSAEGVSLLIQDNEGLEFDTVLVAGQILFIIQEPLNEEIVKYYQKNNYKPNSNNGTVG